MVYRLLGRDNINPNARDNSGFTPLAHACLLGHAHIVYLLLCRRDIDLNSIDNNDVSILAKVREIVTPQYGEEIESMLRGAGAR